MRSIYGRLLYTMFRYNANSNANRHIIKGLSFYGNVSIYFRFSNIQYIFNCDCVSNVLYPHRSMCIECVSLQCLVSRMVGWSSLCYVNWLYLNSVCFKMRDTLKLTGSLKMQEYVHLKEQRRQGELLSWKSSWTVLYILWSLNRFEGLDWRSLTRI
jgi:hypothetical protein